MRPYVSCISCISCVISLELFCNFKRNTHLSCVSCIICVIRISGIGIMCPWAQCAHGKNYYKTGTLSSLSNSIGVFNPELL